ncbi:unnamed protein product [Musa acuminata var. zebrina]
MEGAGGTLFAGFGFLGAGGQTRTGLRTVSSAFGVTHSSTSVSAASGRPSTGLSCVGAVFMGGSRGNSPTTTTTASEPMAAEIKNCRRRQWRPQDSLKRGKEKHTLQGGQLGEESLWWRRRGEERRS